MSTKFSAPVSTQTVTTYSKSPAPRKPPAEPGSPTHTPIGHSCQTVRVSEETWPREARICDSARCTGVRRVVSFSVFGAGEHLYSAGIVENARLMRDLMPDWECWVYLPGSGQTRRLVDQPIVRALQEAGVRLIYYNASDGPNFLGFSTKQRFRVAEDPTIDLFAVRDADARLLLRDRDILDEFEASGMRFHVIYDNSGHGLSAGTILAGVAIFAQSGNPRYHGHCKSAVLYCRHVGWDAPGCAQSLRDA
jgi:hypothetical protein